MTDSGAPVTPLYHPPLRGETVRDAALRHARTAMVDLCDQTGNSRHAYETSGALNWVPVLAADIEALAAGEGNGA